MPAGDEPARTFRISMKNVPVMQVTLDIINEQPDELSELAGVDLSAMAEDILFQLLHGQKRAFDRHHESPMGPDQQPPQVEIDLDRAEAIGLANLLIGVREDYDGTFDSLLLRTIAEFFIQLPDEWVENSNEPLPSVVKAVQNYVNEQ